jgi:transcriptional regulator
MSSRTERPWYWLADSPDDVGSKAFVPAHYQVHNSDALLDIMAANPLAQLFTRDAARDYVTAAPMIVLPTRDNQGRIQLVGHMAGRNPQVRCIEAKERATAVFSDPGAYISPRWFKVTHTAPTWNYQSVQVRGTLERIPAGEPTLEVLHHTIELLEKGAHPDPAAARWSMNELPEEKAAILHRMITAFRLHIDSIEGIQRLNQDKHLEDALSIIAGLSRSPQVGAKAIVSAMAGQLTGAFPSHDTTS